MVIPKKTSKVHVRSAGSTTRTFEGTEMNTDDTIRY
eukprot:CCRYP_002505-RA/>CCRYP_002505-RA protein AED:0.43 eAED:0.43 QI:86/1/1/1/0/0/2/61/35